MIKGYLRCLTIVMIGGFVWLVSAMRLIVEILAGLLMLLTCSLSAQTSGGISPSSEHSGCLSITTVLMVMTPVCSVLIGAVAKLWSRITFMEDRGYKTLQDLLESSEKDRELMEEAVRVGRKVS